MAFALSLMPVAQSLARAPYLIPLLSPVTRTDMRIDLTWVVAAFNQPLLGGLTERAVCEPLAAAPA